MHRSWLGRPNSAEQPCRLGYSLELHDSEFFEDGPVGRPQFGNSLAEEEHLARARIVGDPGRHVHRAAEVVAVAEDDRSGRDSDSGGWQARLGGRLDKVKRGLDRFTRVAEVERILAPDRKAARRAWRPLRHPSLPRAS